jgi:hypothetical protein
MVWISESPKYDTDDKKLLTYLRLRMDPSDAEKIVRFLSLYKYINTHPVRSAKELETIAYYDTNKSRPVFNSSIATKLFKRMKQSGGVAGDEALLLDKAIRGMIGYISEYLPYPIQTFGSTAYYYATFLKRAEEMPVFGPYIDIGKEAAVQGTKTFIVGANDIATDIGGPAGAVAVALPAAIATLFVIVTHLLEDELGEAFLVSFLAVPFVGPTLYKAAGSLGKFGQKMFEHKDTIVGTTRTFLGDGIGDQVEYLIPNMNGSKRFSTRRHKKHKWRRMRSVKR